MPSTYKTPGVYIEEIPKFPPSIAPVDTAIPAFIGYTETAKDKVAEDLRMKPTRITSMVEYELLFGGPQKETGVVVTIEEWTGKTDKPAGITATAALSESARSKHILYYAMQLFYANGGGPCYIVSVKPYKNTVGDALVLKDLEDGLETLKKVDEPTLIVIPESQRLELAEFGTLQQAAVTQCADLQDRFTIMDLHGGTAGSMSEPATDLTNAAIQFRGTITENLKYGAVYGPNVETVFDYVVEEPAIEVSHIEDGAAPAAAKLDTLKVDNNRLYELAQTAIRNLPCKLPPSAGIAGVYATVDNERGVWKAPANVGLKTVIKPTIEISNAEQDGMNIDQNGKSINAIRAFVGRGTLVWGARTLAGNDREWQYVPVRRFFIFVEESIKKATAQFVFEPNDANTWVRVQAMIENFLNTQWRQGALQGIKPEHAYFVSVGLNKTMTAIDILDGKMIIEIGLAAVRPAEFIILRFSHKMAQS